MNNISKRFSQIRKEKKLNIKDFAKLLGEKEELIKDIENNKKILPIELIVKLKNIFKVNPDWLLTGEGNMFLNPNLDIQCNQIIYANNPIILQINNKENVLQNQFFIQILNKNTETLKLIEDLFLNLTEKQKKKEEAIFHKLISYFYDIDNETDYIKSFLKKTEILTGDKNENNKC